jgi:hypothetical protein
MEVTHYKPLLCQKFCIKEKTVLYDKDNGALSQEKDLSSKKKSKALEAHKFSRFRISHIF